MKSLSYDMPFIYKLLFSFYCDRIKEDCIRSNILQLNDFMNL